MFRFGDTVIYRPHSGHEHLSDYPALPAIVGLVHLDGSADLFVLVPNRPPEWIEGVREGAGPHSFSPRDGS